MNQTTTKTTRWQFSIRAMLIGCTLVGICCAIAAFYGRQALNQRFILSDVLPITENYVSSVGYANGRIVWLRVNNIDAHHPNHFDEWIVPIAMNVASNDGLIGKYKDFGDLELKAFVMEQPYLRALDVRRSQVTCEGMIHLEKLKQLEWLWLDKNQATEAGLASLNDLSSLRTVWLPLKEIESDFVERLRVALPAGKFEDSSLQKENLPDSVAMP